MSQHTTNGITDQRLDALRQLAKEGDESARADLWSEYGEAYPAE
jgi:phage gp29-like protein